MCERAEEPASCVAIMLSMEYQAVPMVSFRTKLSGISGDLGDSLYVNQCIVKPTLIIISYSILKVSDCGAVGTIMNAHK